MSAIFPLHDLPEKWKQYTELSASYVQGSKFTSAEYAKHGASERTANVVSDHEISVGFSVSLSGRFKLQGQQALNGILLWQSHANAQGGISIDGDVARAVRFIWYDDGSQISRTQENLQRLIRNDHVDILLGPYSSSLTMAAAEIAEEYKKILWNYGGTSDEIFSRGRHYLVGIASPASDYLRELPRRLAEEFSELSRICVLYSGGGTFGWNVARGVLRSAVTVARHMVHLVPLNVPWENHDTILGILCDIGAEIVVLAGSFQDEVSLMRTRSRWTSTVRVVAAVAAGLRDFSAELAQVADGVLGPSQWEPGIGFSEIIGPSSDWFVDYFQRQFAQTPDYIAAGSFATGLVLTECIRRASSLDDEKLRHTASGLDCNTFYGRFRIDARTGIQTGHRALLIRWQAGQKIVLAPA